MEKRVDKMMPDESRQETIEFDSFTGFIQHVNPSLLDFEHVPRLVETAGRVADGEIDRLMVLMPPRYFKSETFSRLLPAYFLHTHPTSHVGLASYSARLAWKLSGKAREYFKQAGGETTADTDAKQEWATSHGGRMWADGVGGSITGSGFHIGIIDDPMKPQHVRSKAYIEEFRDWYPQTWYNRMEPGAAQIVVMQRLGQQDPIDFLFRREVGEDTDEAPQHWHVLCLDEKKSEDNLADYGGEKGLPPTCTLIEDDRGIGEILAPSRFDEDAVERQQQAAGIHAQAQRQQRPSEPTGDFWEESWFRVYGTPQGDPYNELPSTAFSGGKDWDTAYTADEKNSASAYVESYETPGDKIYVTDADLDWKETPELVAWMQAMEGPHYVEGKASGKSAVQMLRREGVSVQEVDVEGGKFERAAGVQPVVANGRVFVHASVIDTLLRHSKQGLLQVTSDDLLQQGSGLDLNDAFVQAINRHSGGGGSATVSSYIN